MTWATPTITPLVSRQTIAEAPTPYGATNRLEQVTDRIGRVKWWITWEDAGHAVGAVHEFGSVADAVEAWIREHNRPRSRYTLPKTMGRCLDSIVLVNNLPYYQERGNLFRSAIVERHGKHELRNAPAPARGAGLVEYCAPVKVAS
jgi:hypothetical protein